MREGEAELSYEDVPLNPFEASYIFSVFFLYVEKSETASFHEQKVPIPLNLFQIPFLIPIWIGMQIA